MKKFFDNAKAFAAIIIALIKDGGNENEITASEFARMHAKKILALSAAIIFLAASCGANNGITPEEFVNRYNANLVALKYGNEQNHYAGFKIYGSKVDKEGKIFFTGSDPGRSPSGGAIFAILEPGSNKIRELDVVVDLNRTVDTFMFFAAVISHSLDSDKKISEAAMFERIKFIQDLIPEDVNVVSKKFLNGNSYTLKVLPNSNAALMIELK